MALTLDQLLAERPVDRENVDAHKERMLTEVRAWSLNADRSAAH